MKHAIRQLIPATFAFTLALLWTSGLQAAEKELSATLILASNEAGSTDERLKAFEKQLRSMFRYQSYRLVANGSTALESPGRASITLNRSHTLDLEAISSSDSMTKVNAKWRDSEKLLVGLTLTLSDGVPAILGGPSDSSGDGSLILVVVAR